MAVSETTDEFSLFLNSGIYRLGSFNSLFVDPVRILSDSYTRFRISPSSYYSRFFDSDETRDPRVSSDSRRKKRKRRDRELNARELSAENRHQEVRPFLWKAHEAFLEEKDLLSFICTLKRDEFPSTRNEDILLLGRDTETSLIDLGRVWQAPLYEMSLYFCEQKKLAKVEGLQSIEHGGGRLVPIFNNLVVNDTNDDMEAEFLGKWYILPRKSSFNMSDLGRIRDLIPAQSDHGFNLIVIDPPWENGSARQKDMYPTLPNRYFLSLPVKQLAHTEGALVALWVTNREKLRVFVEKELFPTWGVESITCFYWLKVKADGSLIGELDLVHHRPYECLILGYCRGKGIDFKLQPSFKCPPHNQVIISIPADHSRKPPIGKLLLEYTPGPKPARCIELFARELTAGWTCWGNEPLHFQESKYFTCTTS